MQVHFAFDAVADAVPPWVSRTSGTTYGTIIAKLRDNHRVITSVGISLLASSTILPLGIDVSAPCPFLAIRPRASPAQTSDLTPFPTR